MEAWENAWHQDCATVGLAEPSTDLGEIKRAYAKTLRKTRPEDDARAYQALREAYDRVVDRARREAQRAQAEGTSSTGARSVEPFQAGPVETVEPPEQLESAATASAAPAREPSDTKALCDWLQARIDDVPGALPLRWEQLRRDALAAALPELRERLARLPLPEMQEASIRLADLLIRHGDIASDELILLLHAHFAWSGDFRTERLLGRERLLALNALLARVPPQPVDDPELQREFGVLGRLGVGILSPRWMDRVRARIAIVAMGHALSVTLYNAGPERLQRLGVAPHVEREIRTTLKWVNLITWLVMTLVVFGLLRLAGFASETALDWLVVIGGAGLGLPLALLALSLVISFCWAWANVSPAKRWIEAWLPKYGAWLAAIGFIAAGALAQHAGADPGPPADDRFLTAQVVALASLMLAVSHWHIFLPSGLLWLAAAFVLTALAPPSALISLEPGTPGVPALWLGIAAAWVMLGRIVLTQQFYEPQEDLTPRVLWPRGGVFALFLMGTIGMPAGLIWVSVYGGFRVVVAAFMLAATAFAIAPPCPWRPAAGLAGLLVGLALLITAQRIGWRVGTRLMAAPAAAT